MGGDSQTPTSDHRKRTNSWFDWPNFLEHEHKHTLLNNFNIAVLFGIGRVLQTPTSHGPYWKKTKYLSYLIGQMWMGSRIKACMRLFFQLPDVGAGTGGIKLSDAHVNSDTRNVGFWRSRRSRPHQKPTLHWCWFRLWGCRRSGG